MFYYAHSSLASMLFLELPCVQVKLHFPQQLLALKSCLYPLYHGYLFHKVLFFTTSSAVGMFVNERINPKGIQLGIFCTCSYVLTYKLAHA